MTNKINNLDAFPPTSQNPQQPCLEEQKEKEIFIRADRISREIQELSASTSMEKANRKEVARKAKQLQPLCEELFEISSVYKIQSDELIKKIDEIYYETAFLFATIYTWKN